MHAVNLLHRHRLIQRILVVNSPGLDNHHALHGLRFNPHDGVAGRAVVVLDFLARVALPGVCAIGTGELLELRRGQWEELGYAQE